MADGKVLWHTSMSLDGFVAGPDHAMGWMSMDWLPEGEGGLPDQSRQVADSTGAILAGRRWHDALDRLGGLEGIYGGEWTGPVFVLTSRPDPDQAHEGVTFVTGGIEAAVGTALAAAQGRNIVVFGPTIAAQCLAAGLLDEIIVGVAPVLLGDGIRFFGGPGAAQYGLEPISVGPMNYFANLHYRVHPR